VRRQMAAHVVVAAFAPGAGGTAGHPGTGPLSVAAPRPRRYRGQIAFETITLNDVT